MAEENVQSSFEFTTHENIEVVEPVPVTWTRDDGSLRKQLFKTVKILPGGATVTLGSEKEKKDVE